MVSTRCVILGRAPREVGNVVEEPWVLHLPIPESPQHPRRGACGSLSCIAPECMPPDAYQMLAYATLLN